MSDPAIDAPWTEERRNEASDATREICELGSAAAVALAIEDRHLNVALTSTKGDAYRASGVAAGLTYWLYETTLVYLVFKSWAPRWHVKWDFVRASEQHRGPGGPIDLVVTSNVGAGEIAFEAKWWTTRTGKALWDDAEKLGKWVRAAADGEHRARYLLAFWWSDADTLTDHLRDATSWSEGKAELVYRASFATAPPLDKPSRRMFVDIVKPL